MLKNTIGHRTNEKRQDLLKISQATCQFVAEKLNPKEDNRQSYEWGNTIIKISQTT